MISAITACKILTLGRQRGVRALQSKTSRSCGRTGEKLNKVCLVARFVDMLKGSEKSLNLARKVAELTILMMTSQLYFSLPTLTV